jgi:hypothetical protein
VPLDFEALNPKHTSLALSEWLSWAIKSSFATQLPEYPLDPTDNLAAALGASAIPSLLIVLDEADILETYFRPAAGTTVYQAVVKELVTCLRDLPHLVLCMGVSSDLPKVRLKCPFEGPAPVGLMLTHIQLGALEEPHILELLKADSALCHRTDLTDWARRLLQATAGVARLVTYGIELLRTTPMVHSGLLDEQFPRFLLEPCG